VDGVGSPIAIQLVCKPSGVLPQPRPLLRQALLLLLLGGCRCRHRAGRDVSIAGSLGARVSSAWLQIRVPAGTRAIDWQRVCRSCGRTPNRPVLHNK
jgi:hypothetical protein